MFSSPLSTCAVAVISAVVLCHSAAVFGGEFESGLAHLKDGSNVILSLRGYNPRNISKWELYTQSPLSTVLVIVEDIPLDVRFIVFQAHSYLHNVSLSYTKSLEAHSHVNGTNVGLVWQRGSPPAASNFYVYNSHVDNVTIMFAIVAYSAYEPIPGGCNMEFEVETAPYLRVWYTDTAVVVENQPAHLPGIACARPGNIVHGTYRRHLPERDFSSQTYFSALQSMLVPEDVIANGHLAPVPVLGSQMRRVYNVFPGTGSVFAVVARSLTGQAAYVPAITYGCSSIYFEDSCDVLTSTFSKVLCACVFFLGFFTCFFGHSFFKTEMFLSGFMAGGLLSYILITKAATLGTTLNVLVASLAGVGTGSAWLLFWSLYGIPVFSILLINMLAGFILSSLMFFYGLGDLAFAQLDVDYWLTFICVMLTVALLTSSLPRNANIASGALLGAYAVVVPIDHYIGGNLKYIVVSVIRRATVHESQAAILDPPFQLRDAILTAVWISMTLFGTRVQLHHNRNRSPFPPPPCPVSVRLGGSPSDPSRTLVGYSDPTPGEPALPVPFSPPQAQGATPTLRTPLRVQARIPYRYGSVGDDDVFDTPPENRRRGLFRWISGIFSRRA